MVEKQQVFAATQLGLEFFHFSVLARPFPPHFHERSLIGCLVSGARLMRIGNAQTLISPRNLVFIPPYLSHACEALRGMPSEWFCVHAHLDYAPTQPLILRKQPEISAAFLNLAANAFSGASLAAWPIFIQRLKATCATLADTTKPNPRQPLEQLTSHCLAAKISLADMAASQNMNKFQFLRQFRAHKNITPHKYLTNLRIIHSQRLLRQGSPIIECAAACGFYDQSHFARAFKASIGITPGFYRSSFLANKAA